MALGLDAELPAELLPFKDRIEATVKPYIEIKARREEKLALRQSKIGGTPCLPKGTRYPLDSKRRPLFLLAQLNFAEMPGLEGFPDSGILQFYISGADTLYGASFKNPEKQGNFRVLYWPCMPDDDAALASSTPVRLKADVLPFEGPCGLSFALRHAPITAVDYQFARRILNKDLDEWSDEARAVAAPYEEFFQGRAPGHRLGGYPYFVQSDPRRNARYREQGYVLLLQIDTDMDAGIMWGDAGVGNFFIREQDLRRKDFSRILYNWDCG